MRDPYEILNVDRDVTQDQLNDAKKKLAKKLHPDKNPDNRDATAKFQEMMDAYELLASPSRRQHYDDTGQWQPAKSFEKYFVEVIQAVFVKIAEEVNDPKLNNPILIFQDHIRGVHSSGLRNKEKIEQKIERLHEVKKRLSYDGDEEDLITKSLNLQLRQYEINLNDFQEEFEMIEKVIEVLDYYGYDLEKIQRITTSERPGFIRLDLGGGT